MVENEGGENLAAILSRGELLRVGGYGYTVCIDISSTLLYNATHIPLCSTNNAWKTALFQGKDASRLPIFILDTSLGASKQPTVGDMFLKTINSAGQFSNLSRNLNRGDLIRVGHPILGETFRVSTNLSRAFTDQVLPLATGSDSSIDASLSLKALIYSSYLVQSVMVTASEARDTLTPSDLSTFGFRLKFGLEKNFFR